MYFIVFFCRQNVMQALEHFEVYSSIWARAVDVELADFLARDPKVNEFEAVVREYELLEIDINAEPAIFDIGPIAIVTGAYSTLQYFTGSADIRVCILPV